MERAIEPGRGGFRRPIQLSTWIRDELADGRETYAQQLYGGYSAAVRAIPFARGRKGTRKPISYHGFLSYLYALRQLGLIEYVMSNGDVYEEEAMDKGGNPAPHLAKRRYFRADISRLGDAAWENIWLAYSK